MFYTVKEFVAFMEENFSDNVAFQFYENEELHKVTFSQYVNEIRKFASYLQSKVPDIAGKHVGILAGNDYRYMVCFLGTILAKAVVVPFNIQETWENTDRDLKFTDISYIFTDESYKGRQPALVENYSEVLLDMYEYVDADVEIVDFDVDEDAVAAIILTSGTTGTNKGVMLSQKNIFTALQGVTGYAAGAKKEIYFTCYPLYHVSGLGGILNININGNTAILCSSPKYYVRELMMMGADHLCTIPAALPGFLRGLKGGQPQCLGGAKTIWVGGAKVEGELVKEFLDFGISIVQIYSTTELFSGGTIINSAENPDKIASVGKPAYECEMKVENDEICIKSNAVMKGYYKDPEATAEVIIDGWFHTGDLGYIDDEGFLFITGRKKNLIILPGGENVSPEELEKLLSESKAIKEVLVKEKNNKICAEIFCDNDTQDEARAYVDELNRKLPIYKRITLLEFRSEEFPKTSIGKIIRA